MYEILIRSYNAHYALHDHNFFFLIIVNLLFNQIIELNNKRFKIKIIKVYLINIKFAYVNIRYKDFIVF